MTYLLIICHLLIKLIEIRQIKLIKEEKQIKRAKKGVEKRTCKENNVNYYNLNL